MAKWFDLGFTKGKTPCGKIGETYVYTDGDADMETVFRCLQYALTYYHESPTHLIIKPMPTTDGFEYHLEVFNLSRRETTFKP